MKKLPPVRRGPGAPKGTPKAPHSGRKLGTKNKDKVTAEQELRAQTLEVFSTLTEAQIKKITPLEVLQLCTQAAVRAGAFGLAVSVAREWAPYVHPKMAPTEPKAGDVTVVIQGGLPERPR